MLLLLLVVSVLAASISAYMLAARLFPSSRLDSIALALTLFLTILITATTAMGFLSLLQPIPITLSVFGLSALTWWTSRRVKSLIPVQFQDTPFERPKKIIDNVMLILAWLLFLTLAFLFFALYLVQSYRYMITNGDVLWIYMPNILNFVQAHSVWDFHGLSSYFSFNYELLFSWSILYTDSYALVGWFHLLPAIGVFMYGLSIFNLLAKDVYIFFRLIGGLVLIPALMSLHITQHMFYDFGKNDHFVLYAVLMGIYYLMCYWNKSEQPDNRYLLLVGLACGLLIGSKYTGVYWVALLAVAHLCAFLRKNPRQLFSLGWKHFVYVLLPMLVLAVPWLLRTLSVPNVVAADQFFVELSFGNRIIHLYHVPIMMSTASEWLPALVIGAVGILVLMISRLRWLQMLGGVGIVCALYQIYMQSNFPELYIGPYYAGIILLSLILVFTHWRRTLLTDSVISVILLTLTMLVILAFMPFSAWTEGENYVDPDYMVISFRYAPAIILLLVIAIGAICTRLWAQNTFVSNEQGNTVHPKRTPQLRATGTVYILLIVGSLIIRVFTFQQQDTWRLYDNWEGRFERPTEVYRWVNQNLSNTSVYPINLPVTAFYGRDFDNRVYIMPEVFFLGEQVILERLTSYINENRIAYIAVSVAFGDDIYFGNVHDTPQLRAEIARMRQEYEVVFEDEQAIIFATSYSEETANP